MRNALPYLALLATLASCSGPSPLVGKELAIDLPRTVTAPTDEDLQFWKKRADADRSDFVSAGKFGRALVARFRAKGAIEDLLLADSIFTRLAAGKEPDMLLQLAGVRMLRHQFATASVLIEEVEQTKAEPYAAAMMGFDTDLELGRYGSAANRLRAFRSPRDFAYTFRLARKEHMDGNADSAVAHLLHAADLVPSNPHLQSIALSNAADLCLHEGKLDQAVALYQRSLKAEPADYHSLSGLAWIAAVHDRNDSLAFSIFHYVDEQTQSPDVLFRMAQCSKDEADARKYAQQFVAQALRPEYGSMYHKYLIQLYTGILNQPEKALPIAEDEARDRPTPQTAAWLAWAQFRSGQSEAALRTFKERVSGKPLEGQELFWMGMMMKGLGRGYDAASFLKAARRNRYDLSWQEAKALEESL